MTVWCKNVTIENKIMLFTILDMHFAIFDVHFLFYIFSIVVSNLPFTRETQVTQKFSNLPCLKTSARHIYYMAYGGVFGPNIILNVENS